MTEEKYHILRSRTKSKFLVIGALLFPILFFLAQFIVQKDKLSFYYLIFLLGSSFYLLTILDDMPFFELSPKILTSVGTGVRLFVLSTLLTFIGLVKYIHFFIDISSWSRPLLRTGNILLGFFGVIVSFVFLNISKDR